MAKTLEEFLKEIGKGATTGIGLTKGVRGILDTLGIGDRWCDEHRWCCIGCDGQS